MVGGKKSHRERQGRGLDDLLDLLGYRWLQTRRCSRGHHPYLYPPGGQGAEALQGPVRRSVPAWSRGVG
jgi:hypothetical protein